LPWWGNLIFKFTQYFQQDYVVFGLMDRWQAHKADNLTAICEPTV
jgi:hypothetical protein